jgi:histidine triad (HIT) family protein
VAIRDVNPRAPVHLLILPERHVESFKDIDQFSPDEAKRMLDFIAETAAQAGLDSYRVAVNCGPDAGQTVYHLHWHVLGGHRLGPEG